MSSFEVGMPQGLPRTKRSEGPAWQTSRFNSKMPGPASGMIPLRDDHVRQSETLEELPASREATTPGIFDAFVKTCQRWRLAEHAQATLLGYESNEFLGRQLLRGYVPPRTQDVRDRIGYVLAISLGLGALFNENADAEVAWLRTEHPTLRMPPIDLMLRGRMINLITVADLVRAERAL